MNSSRRIEPRTQLFARVLGPYLVFLTVIALARASDVRTLMSEFGANRVWPWVTGVFVLLCGLVIVTLHPRYGNAPAFIVSLVGWLTVLKGVLLLAVPNDYVSAGNSILNSGGWWEAVMVVTAVTGIYLSYVGWTPVGGSAETRMQVAAGSDGPRTAQ
jgi:hypothetical protein